ncbi:MAG: energy transducer TonB [Pseudomonadota bacterium]
MTVGSLLPGKSPESSLCETASSRPKRGVWRSLPQLRLVAAATGGALITLAIAWFMQSLIAADDVPLAAPETLVITDWMRPPEPETRRVKKEKIDPPDPVDPPPAVPRWQETGSVGVEITPTAPNIPTGPTVRKAVLLADGDAMTLVQARPLYPESAKRRGVTGYVVVEYDVLPSGKAADARIIESQPRGVFDRSAVNAVLKSRFRPEVVNGEPQRKKQSTNQAQL